MVTNLEVMKPDSEDIIGEEEIAMILMLIFIQVDKITTTLMVKIIIAMVFLEKMITEFLIKIYIAKIVDKLVLQLLVIVLVLTSKSHLNIWMPVKCQLILITIW